MPAELKRATVYFDPELHRALRIKAAETERSLSALVNEAVKLSLAEDADDLAAFDRRAAEPDLPFESVVHLCLNLCLEASYTPRSDAVIRSLIRRGAL